ncbi:MAG: lytic transglycosylase domain-containing protein [bacterium]
MWKISLTLLATTLAQAAVMSCATVSRPVTVKLDTFAPGKTEDQSLRADRQRLADYLQKNPTDRGVLEDALLLLDASIAEERGSEAQAKEAWFRALGAANGAFGERAFAGWLRALAKVKDKKLDRREMARLVLSETRGGSHGPWMLARSLQTEEKIIPYLLREIPESVNGVAVDAKVSPPSIDGIPANDPLLNKLSDEVCRHKSQRSPDWETWQKTLTPDVSKYFEALVSHCMGESSKALTSLSDVAPRLAANAWSAPLALESFARMIKIRRDQGERESVAPLYMPYMQLWKNPAINESTLGLTRAMFEQRRIDETLWAARARATVGDGESARVFADDVLNYVSAALLHSYALSSEQKNNLAATAAETYHLLAFRLAVEARDWDKSFNIAELALNQATLPDEWVTRFRWSQGLYRFLASDFDQARKIWERLLTESSDEKIRPQLLFWLACAHDKVGNKSEASFYRKSLAEDYPVSFYSVVALQLTGDDHAVSWQKSFKDLKELRKRLDAWQRVDIDDLRNDMTKGKLLRKAEILASLRISDLAGVAIDELQRSIEPSLGRKKDLEWALYISRLHAAAGNWLGTISLTTKMMKTVDFWRERPEQFLLYFPRPYLSIYSSVAEDLDMDRNELLAISRQESSFKADARSGANAWGLMQLMPFTAKRLVKSTKISGKEQIKIPEDLMKPEVNIPLATDYVRELQSRFNKNQAQVYAAYNAGVQTVDSWLARRLFEDRLLFIELIPYQETREYVKGVWRNQKVYDYLSSNWQAD